MLACLGATVYSSVGKSNTLVFDESFITGLGNSVTFVRATTATNEDFEPLIKTIPISGSRHEGARGVQNLIGGSSEDFTNAAWALTSGAVVNSNQAIAPNGTLTADEIDLTADTANSRISQTIASLPAGDYVLSLYLKAKPGESGDFPIRVFRAAPFDYNATIDDSAWKRFSILYSSKPAGNWVIYPGCNLVAGETLRKAYIWGIDFKNVTGQANQNPSEYVSVGVGTGSELVTNGTFDSDTDWVKDTGWAISGGTANRTSRIGVQYIKQDPGIELISGLNYVWEFDVSNIIGGDLNASVGLFNQAASENISGYIEITDGHYAIAISPSATTTGIRIYDNSASGSSTSFSIDNISVKKADHGANIDGLKYFDTENGNGVNLFPEPEDLENAAWLDIGSVTVTANAGTDPDGGNTAASLSVGAGAWYWYDDVTVTNNTVSFYVKRNAGTDQTFRLFVGGDYSVIKTATDTWQRFTYTRTGASASNAGIRSDSGAGPAAELLIWHPMLNAGPTAGPYSNALNVVAEATGSAIAAATTKGLLIEEASTNVITYSKDFDEAGFWTSNTSTITQDETAPDGTLTAWSAEDASAVAVQSIRATGLSLDFTSNYTLSAYLKKTTSQTTYPAILFWSEAEGAGAGVTIDTDNGTLTDRTGGAPDDKGIVDAGEFWRAWITWETFSSGNHEIYFYSAYNTDGTGTGSSAAQGTSVWSDAQLEKSSYPTAYIPTSGTAVTRDLEEVDGDATLYKDTMTITGEFNTNVDTGTGAVVFEFSDGTASNLVVFRKRVGADDLDLTLNVGGVLKYRERASWTPGTTKFAIALSPTIGESAVYIDGARLDATPSTDAGHTGLEGTVDEFRIGRFYDDTIPLNGTIKNLKIYHELKDATWLAADSTP